MRVNRLIAAAATALMVVGAFASRASAQALGPQRQFLAVEPYYEFTRVDQGDNTPTTNASGVGARIWINGAPFHFPLNSSIALFGSVTPEQNELHQYRVYYGGQLDQYFVRRPLGGIIDPFISVGAGAYYVEHRNSQLVGGPLHNSGTRFALSPGGGIRIPAPNRFELRVDAKDLLIFQDRNVRTGVTRTSNNLLIQAGLGLTF